MSGLSTVAMADQSTVGGGDQIAAAWSAAYEDDLGPRAHEVEHEPLKAGVVDRWSGRRLVVVGGVPGAGKTAVIAAVASELNARALDPEQIHQWLARHLPSDTPYQWYRLWVHLGHAARVLVALTCRRDVLLLIHAPANRWRRRRLGLSLARRYGWRTVLVIIDVSRQSALAGQKDRHRVLGEASFQRHWRRSEVLREAIIGGSVSLDDSGWDQVVMVDRTRAIATLRTVCVDRTR